MPALRVLSILTLLGCAAYATSGFAQEPDGVEETTGAETTVLGAEGARENSGIEFPTVDSLRVPCACDAEATDGKREAYQAAQADPGILMYTEPPAGTEMPIHEPPEDVDPEMIWPVDPSLEPPENLDLEEIRPFDP